jgi:hypothetical protein
MQTAERRSRWADPKFHVHFHEPDLNICKLLTPDTIAREPWGYTYLPTNYFAPLLGRGEGSVPNRLAQLRAKPNYITLADQPRNNYRSLVYQLATAGADEVREALAVRIRLEPRALAHELGACLIASSIELGARKHDLPIQVIPTPPMERRPDWPIFTLAGRAVLIEFDTGTESLEVIEGKYEVYLQALEDKLFRRPLFLFITTKKFRVENLMERLKRTIDKHKYPYAYAERFAFGAMEYDRFLNTIPKPSGWAVTYPYQRAGHEPFRFVEGG